MDITTEKFEKIVNAFLSLKNVKYSEDFSSFVRNASSHLNQLGIWEESKHILKDYILMYWGFDEGKFKTE